MEIYQPDKSTVCSKIPPLTYINKNFESDTVTLHFNFSAVGSYKIGNSEALKCCYQEVYRTGEGDWADNSFK